MQKLRSEKQATKEELIAIVKASKPSRKEYLKQSALEADRHEALEKKLNPQTDEEREALSRDAARRLLLHYIERSMPTYMPGWVHEDICRRLEKFVIDVEQQLSPRLMLWLPPRHGKSEIASVRFPEWVLGRHPEWEFISTSYSDDLPLSFSRRIRARLQEETYRVLFPKTELSKDTTSVEMWKTTRGGGYRAAGVGGGITGMGAHILMVDDPFKDQEQADSEVIREKVWDWFTTTAYTRLAPGGGICVVQTRWHDADLSGRLQENMHEVQKELSERYAANRSKRDPEEVAALSELEKSYDRWDIVSYPAIATADEYFDRKTGRIVVGPASVPSTHKKLREKGEALHPERFNKTQLLKIKRVLQPRHWSALYQQNPVPDEGLYFTKDMFRYEPDVPNHKEMYVFVAWDLAIGLKQTNDWTVGVVGALDYDDNLHIIDMVRGRWTALQIAEAIIGTHVKYDATMTGIEKGVLEMSIKPQLEKLMLERRQYIALAEGEQALRPVTDKIARARPLQGRMQQGKVVLPERQPWVETLRGEFLRFPGGVHDDIVDASAWLARLVLGQAPPPKPKNTIKFTSWKEKLRNFVDQSPNKGWMAS
jgi:predicted phage terminase large subunit-like protein